ncbi:aminoglycoside phosphotransferase (APT) family kinase protein [Saccharothrix tamanrassetensis]|uniref:Aminoglycoside phosphotransferase (APT) family kinase protein n=1 Tax=Saccharothrix tamanrassetensis TaxID=1051531 RepID=A0A841CDY9_9PSEU|nr:phosphotransferase [Saccharothrix tamanrassetensis]MBB5955183.1 aminoglycoside phosphotransferase (APT) family kinase protein [Saccharothrix tamanrassetensis]
MTPRDEAHCLLASGREADVYLRPDGLLLKRSRTGRDAEPEARLMRYLGARGIPVPRVHDASAADLVMEYVPGPRMSQELDAKPWRAGALGRELADLHRRLDEVQAPDFLPGEGRLLHLDLHPGNVVLGPAGPVVVDWACAQKGDRRVDVALSWLAIAVAPLRPFKRLARSRLTRGFLSGVDREVRRAMPAAAEIRLARHTRDPIEVSAVHRLVASCSG